MINFGCYNMQYAWLGKSSTLHGIYNIVIISCEGIVEASLIIVTVVLPVQGKCTVLGYG